MSNICGVLIFREPWIEDNERIYLDVGIEGGWQQRKPSVWAKKNIALLEFPAEEDAPVNHKTLRIVADTVLTNRTELLKKFGVFHSGQGELTNKQIILRAYEEWGENCPQHLSGDFAFAIWDSTREKLFCARDHYGARTLFYYKDSNKFVFGTRPKWVLEFPGVKKRFNTSKLGIFLIPEPHLYCTDQSWFEDISVLPAGTSLTIDRKNFSTKKYWTPKIQSRLPFESNKKIVAAFRDLLFEIIESRIPSDNTVGCLLSGGLDSSSIVSVAAKILEKQNRSLEVFAGVLEEGSDSEFSDERFYIDQFKQIPNVNINYVTAPGSGPFSDLEEIFECLDTPFLTSRHFLYSAFAREAERIGTETLFDGAFGELGATSHGAGGFAELFAGFKWLTLWRELRLRKHLYNDSIKYNVRANIINPFLPQFVINLKHGQLRREIPYNEHNPLRSDLTKDLLGKIDPDTFEIKRISPNQKLNQINDQIYFQQKMGEHFYIDLGKHHIEFQYPLLDKRLIEFASAVPLELKLKNGYSRYLIRVALDNILPAEIQWRTTKSPFSPDFLRRYNAQIDKIRELLAGIKPNDPVREIIDVEKVTKWANLQIANNEMDPVKVQIARDHLPQAIYLIYFLRQFPEFRF